MDASDKVFVTGAGWTVHHVVPVGAERGGAGSAVAALAVLSNRAGQWRDVLVVSAFRDQLLDEDADVMSTVRVEAAMAVFARLAERTADHRVASLAVEGVRNWGLGFLCSIAQ